MRKTPTSLEVRVGFLEEGTWKNSTCKDLEARDRSALWREQAECWLQVHTKHCPIIEFTVVCKCLHSCIPRSQQTFCNL